MPDSLNPTERVALKAGQNAGRIEAVLLGLPTLRLYRFSTRHPRLYLLLAFLLGAFIIAAFTVSTYLGRTDGTIDLAGAFWLLVAGSAGGGLAMAVIAVVWQRTIRPTLGAMERDGIISGG